MIDSDIQLRLMQRDDLPRLVLLQTLCYPDHYLESEAVIVARFERAPDTAWVAVAGGEVQAYLVGYRSRLQKISPLGAPFEPAAAPDALYLHDLAVAPALAGRGVGAGLVKLALAQARAEGLGQAALVAVGGAAPFWERRGFRRVALDCPQARAALASYDSDACYMARATA